LRAWFVKRQDLFCFLVAFFSGLSSRDADEVDGHADAEGGEDETEDDGVAGDAAGLPGARGEFVDQLDMAKDGAEGDDDAESDQGHSGPEG